MSETEEMRFEVLASAGPFSVIGPTTLPPAEAKRIGDQLATLLALVPFVCAGCGDYIAGEYWHEGCATAPEMVKVAKELYDRLAFDPDWDGSSVVERLRVAIEALDR